MRVNWVLFQSFTFQNHQQWPRLLDCRKNVSIFKDKKLISFYRKSFENDSSTVKMCQMFKCFSTRKSQHFFRVWRIIFETFVRSVWPLLLLLIGKKRVWFPKIQHDTQTFHFSRAPSKVIPPFWSSFELQNTQSNDVANF